MIVHKEITIPDNEEVVFVGDIHGDWNLFEKLRALLEEYYVGTRIHFVCVGDLIDRGKQSLRALLNFKRKIFILRIRKS